MPNALRTSHVALFSTCLVDQVLPEIGIATVALLERLGVEVVYPPGQTCCGQPWFNSGFRPEALRLARRTIDIFQPFDAVVLPSGSCTAMLRVEYPHLFESEPAWRQRAQALAEKTYELAEFLVGVSDSANQQISELARQRAADSLTPRFAGSITYHDSCHMCRNLGLREEPRAALRAAGAEIVEMAESDRCCGFGGLFSLRLPEVSAAMAGAKLGDAAASGAATVVTADPGCLLHMRRGAGEDGLMIEHLAVVLEELTR